MKKEVQKIRSDSGDQVFSHVHVFVEHAGGEVEVHLSAWLRESKLATIEWPISKTKVVLMFPGQPYQYWRCEPVGYELSPGVTVTA